MELQQILQLIKGNRKWILTKLLLDGGRQSKFTEDGEPTGENYEIKPISLKQLKVLLNN